MKFCQSFHFPSTSEFLYKKYVHCRGKSKQAKQPQSQAKSQFYQLSNHKDFEWEVGCNHNIIHYVLTILFTTCQTNGPFSSMILAISFTAAWSQRWARLKRLEPFFNFQLSDLNGDLKNCLDHQYLLHSHNSTKRFQIYFEILAASPGRTRAWVQSHWTPHQPRLSISADKSYWNKFQ